MTQHPAIRQHTLACLLALLGLLLVLLEKGTAEWSILVVLLGCAGILLRWPVVGSPPLVLVCVLVLLLAQLRGMDLLRVLRLILIFQGVPGQDDTLAFDLMDLLLCVSLLVYSASYYRLMSLVGQIFPADPRQRKRPWWTFTGLLTPVVDRKATGERPFERRSPAAVLPRELPFVVVAGVVWSLAAMLFWGLLTRLPVLPGFPEHWWRVLLLFWLSVLGLWATSAVLAYVNQTHGSTEENLLYLQDQLWRQTRREQSRLNRWLVWARLRQQRRKEGQ
jgi:hypothetical protein